MIELPRAFKEEMKALLGEEYPAYLSIYERPVRQGFRLNSRKLTKEKWESIDPFGGERVPWTENGYYIENEWGKEKGISPSRHPYYYAGLYYIQEPSAMTPASRLPIEPGERVLDLCAAPGGKATELGSRLSGKGFLVANDISSSRAKALLKNLEMTGLTNYYVTSEDPEKLREKFPGFFHKILIDAPCSGEGMFHKEPQMAGYWEEKPPAYYSEIQKNLILQGADMLRPGGMLLYSTCTFSKQENEEVIAFLLKERPDMETFYGLKLAYEAGRRGGSLPTVFNAANERAVAMFLDRKIRYLQIPEIIQACMEQHRNISEPTVEEILKTEQETYEFIKSRW